MSRKAVTMIAILAASLALAACQQQTKPAPQTPVAVPPAPASQPAVPTAKPEAPAPTTHATASAKPMAPKPVPAVAKAPVPAPAPAPAKPAATAPTAPKPAVSSATVAKPEAPAPKPAAVSMPTFSTMRCMACHAIDHDKVGPAWKSVVAAYGDEATLAKAFDSGFAVKDRKIASTEAKWKGKAGLMTMQYRSLIKGHGKVAAHALFETVKRGKFGSY